jgi:hypothetical protein
MSIEATSELASAPAHPRLLPLAAAAACAALADWLFFGWQIGISLALFFAVIGIVAAAVNDIHAQRHVQIVMTSVFVAGLLALVEEVGTLSVILSALSTASFVIVMTAAEASSWQRQLLQAALVPLRGPFQLLGDIIGALRHMKRWTPEWLGSLVAWIVPLVIFAIFLTLLSQANPLIEQQLMRIDLRAVLDVLISWRFAFWIAVVCAIWPLMHRHAKRKTASQPTQTDSDTVEPQDMDYLFGAAAMLRSLILFNLLFALQSVLDLTYLWGGAALPGGMSHAEYAHRGAYPLIVTALLAAGFVLVAMRPNGPAETSRWIRPLVLVWTSQNILLVISSIFRLDLYIVAFTLTYLRLAALVWMLLVAIGLLLILVQIVMKKPNSWLLSANALSLALVLYGCCFVNAPSLVASYNIEHSQDAGGTGPYLDRWYLASLGPQALPALEANMKAVPWLEPTAVQWRACLNRQLSLRSNWRAWGFRTWRLKRYLANNPEKSSTPPSDQG